MNEKSIIKENYYTNIKELLLKSEIYDKVKEYSKDRNKVRVYYEIGELLNKAGKKYGKNIIKQYSMKLMVEVGKKYNERNLRYMRQFYVLFTSIKWNPVGSKLSWSHYRELLALKNKDEIFYYIKICEEQNLSKNQLHEYIKNKKYERLECKTITKLLINNELGLPDLIPNPITIKLSGSIEKLTEYALKQAILCNLDEFLLELGFGFTYIGNEFKIKIGNKYNYIDLFLYNIKFRCYVVIELKVTELKSGYTGQIQNYINYVNRNIKTVEENDTVGIIICKKNNKFVIDYCSDKRILSREYKLI